MAEPFESDEYIACQGENGACGYTVAQRPEIKAEYQTAPQPTYEEVFELLSEGRSSKAVVAIENSRTGNIVEPLDLITRHNVGVIGEVYQQIDHYVLITKALARQFGIVPAPNALSDEPSREDIQRALNASREKQEAILSAIVELRSDDQGLKQCGDFVSRNMPAARRVTMSCTSSAAKSIKTETDDLNTEVMNPPSSFKVAAIASSYCAKMYDLIVIGRVKAHAPAELAPESQPIPIQDYGADNITRYLTLQRGTPKLGKMQDETARYVVDELIWDEAANHMVVPQKAAFETLNKLAGKPHADRDVIDQRDRVLADAAGFLTAAKIWHFVALVKGDKKKPAPHMFDRLERIVRLLKHRSYNEDSPLIGFMGGAFARGKAPFDQLDTKRERIFREAEREVEKKLDRMASKPSEKGQAKTINAYRTFVLLTAPKDKPSIYPVLGELLGSKHVDVAMVQVLPAESKGEGMRALVELKAYIAKGPRGLIGDAKLIEDLNNVARNADAAASTHSRAKAKPKATYKLKGGFIARNVKRSVAEGQGPEGGGDPNRDKTSDEPAAQSRAPELTS